MSMSTSIVGIKPPDEKWKKMKSVFDACEKAGIDIPEEIDEYFQGEIPDEKGVIVYLSGGLNDHKCCTEWSDDCSNGYEIDLSKLPKDIKMLRFFNSW